MPELDLEAIRKRLETYAPGKGPAGLGPSWNDIRALLAEVDRLNRCVGDALFALEDPHGNLSDAHLPIVRAALAQALHPDQTEGAANA